MMSINEDTHTCIQCESQVSNSSWEGCMRKTDSHNSKIQLSEVLACAQPDVLGLGWIERQWIWWHPGHQGIRGQGHWPNGHHGIRCQTVQVGLDIISVQLTQPSTGSKERTKLRCVDGICMIKVGMCPIPWLYAGADVLPRTPCSLNFPNLCDSFKRN